MKYINPKNDIAFKKIFANDKKKNILIGFLNAILEKNIIDVTDQKSREIMGPINEKYKDKKEYYHWVEDGEDCYKQKPDCLLIGWMWYVFIMGIAAILNGRLFIWALATYTFVKWRKKKIKEG